MDSLLLSVIVGCAVIITTFWMKKLWLTQKESSLTVAWVLAIAYRAFQKYLPVDMQAEIVASVTSVIGIAKVLYDLVTSAVDEGKK